MIRKIRDSRYFKNICFTLSILGQIIVPLQALSLTGGPSQPEFSSFKPIGISDMVDLSSGDMSYNIPLMDVGGYPINIAYNASPGTDDESSMVGLGWNISVGQINHNVRGLSDDFDGSAETPDLMQYEDFIKPNVTVGGDFSIEPNLVGVEVIPKSLQEKLKVSGGLALSYNNYTGASLKISQGMSLDLCENISVGYDVSTGKDGLSISPNINIHRKKGDKLTRNSDLGCKIGCSYNSMQGLTSMSIEAYRKKQDKACTKLDDKSEVIDDDKTGMRLAGVGGSISYANEIFTPTVRAGFSHRSFSANVGVGPTFFGFGAEGKIKAFGMVSFLKEKKRIVKAFGYPHTEKAEAYTDQTTLDINREKDGSVTVNTTNLPITNYLYDLHAVQGQGVSGQYRPYRSQVGYVYDGYAKDGSFSSSLGVETEVGSAFHVGFDGDVIFAESHSGIWKEVNGASVISQFKKVISTSPDYEKVYYKNVGDLSVDQNFSEDETYNNYYQLFNRVGKFEPVQIPWIGGKFARQLTSKYGIKGEVTNYGKNTWYSDRSWTEKSSILINAPLKRDRRKIRNQSIVKLTNTELKNGVGYRDLINFKTNSVRKSHHTGQIQIIRNDGARYIYGLPAYNISKKEVTFAVEGNGVDQKSGIIKYGSSVASIIDEINKESDLTKLPNDQYYNSTKTPSYIHSHLLTSVLSTDYQDLSGDGPSEDDLGSYTKFEYQGRDEQSAIEKANSSYRWRIPYEKYSGTYNEGLKSDFLDDQANYIYGEKEIYYIKKIETKTHIAIFKLSKRKDGFGVIDEQGGLDQSQYLMKLSKISLYTKPDYDKNGSMAIPIKEVHFEYNYDLCTGIPNNNNNQDRLESEIPGFNNKINNGGKLTLKKIYFTYKGSKMGKYTSYEFNYHENVSNENPSYNIKGYDCWGNYKPNLGNGSNASEPTNAEFPYINQRRSLTDNTRQNQDIYSSVWTLKEITLPSGGEIIIDYESDDYQTVQDRKAMQMFHVVGAGNTPSIPEVTENSDELTSQLYNVGQGPNQYLYIQIPEDELPSSSTMDKEYNKYFNGIKNNLLQFRFLVNMNVFGNNLKRASDLNKSNSKYDYVSGYAQFIDRSMVSNEEDKPVIFKANGKYYLSILLEKAECEGGFLTNLKNKNPIAKAGWEFGRKHLPREVNSLSSGANGGATSGTAITVDLFKTLFQVDFVMGLFDMFTGPNAKLAVTGIASTFIKKKSFVRLNEPYGAKLGGGSRVKTVKMKDVWEKMNPGQIGYKTMNYGQEYSYTVEKDLDDNTSTPLASSGVATYEPIGNGENPFVNPVFVTEKHLLAPSDVSYKEEPFGESFFPSPQVTYSRVVVKNLEGGEIPDDKQVKALHKTGYVVTEFYTTKDFPTITDQTVMQGEEDNTGLLGQLLTVYTMKKFIASQGYVIHTNDMNGKKKKESVYNAQSNFISSVEYKYREHKNKSNINSSSSTSAVNQGKLDNRVPVLYPDGSIKLNTIGVECDVVNDLRENATSSNTYGVKWNLGGFFLGFIPVVVPIPIPKYAGADDEFHSVTTTKVINTFGLLEETIATQDGASVSTKNLAWDALTGEVLLTQTTNEYEEEYYTMNYPAHWAYPAMGPASLNIGFEGVAEVNNGRTYLSGHALASTYLIEGDEIVYGTGIKEHAWVSNVNGDTFTLIGQDGGVINLNNDVAFKIVRSGHRNLQSAGIMNITLMFNPLLDPTGYVATNPATHKYLNKIGVDYLKAQDWKKYRIINAGAVKYSDVWDNSCECGIQTEGNPYLLNKRGVWRTKSSHTYLTGRNYLKFTTGRNEGLFTSFAPFYQISKSGQWVQNEKKWTAVSEVSKFSPFGFELENKDALDRHSGAQYGYNNKLPMAVGANTRYKEIAFDGFEDYDYEGCGDKNYDHFRVTTDGVDAKIDNEHSHTGKHSVYVRATKKLSIKKQTSN